jgi:protein TonB
MRSRSLSLSLILVATSSAFSQSGRRAKEVKPPPPIAAEPPQQSTANPAKQETSPVTAEKNEDYKCTEDKSLVRIIDSGPSEEQILSPKEVDARAAINSRPKPAYTKEARRKGIQGFVILKVVLSSEGKVSRVRVVRGLPFGLTENAIRAACRIDFKPAIKRSKPVSQWVTVEYAFRLADSSILGP